MPRYRLNSIAELARQLDFAPANARIAQLVAAEGLLHDIDPAKAYPLDFVVFRITGYRPRRVGRDLLTGLALQHDLGLLVEQVSDSLNLFAASAAEPVLAIEDVTERFNVTSKTIQRWRRRGLPARRFSFPDGRRRVGFLLSSVERFVAAHRDQVGRSANISRVSDDERWAILRAARRLSIGRCSPNEITRRIGRRFRRSPLFVLHTIRRHDQERPAEAIFAQAGPEISDADRAAILAGHRRGAMMRELAAEFRRPRSMIHRVLLDERLARLNRKRITFIDDPLYHGPGAEEAVEQIVAAGELPAVQAGEQARVPKGLPAYFAELYRTPLLGPGRERAMFLQFNFYKFQFVTARRRLDEQTIRRRDLDLLEARLHQVQQARNALLRANLRLVVSVARKHLRPGLELMELISEGNITLMRAVESFDPHKGNRFSTYVTLSLMKGFARSVSLLLAGKQSAGGRMGMLDAVADARAGERLEQRLAREQISGLLSRLDERERAVLVAHYGLDGREREATLGEVAATLKLPRHHITRIEQSAMAKLRAAGE